MVYALAGQSVSMESRNAVFVANRRQKWVYGLELWRRVRLGASQWKRTARTCFDPPCTPVIDEGSGAKARYVGWQDDAEGVLGHANRFVLDIVRLEPEDLCVVCENPGVGDIDTAQTLFIAAD